jgi:hypothetical protein
MAPERRRANAQAAPRRPGAMMNRRDDACATALARR